MTTDSEPRVLDDAVVEAARIGVLEAMHQYKIGERVEDVAERYGRAALSAAADALEGAILAPVAAYVERQIVLAHDDNAHEEQRWLDLRAVIADPDAVAKHNAAIWDEGAQAVLNCRSVLADMPHNPYRTTEGTD